MKYAIIIALILDIFDECLNWYASTGWYWYYTIDPFGYYFFNCWMLANMLYIWALIRSGLWNDLIEKIW